MRLPGLEDALRRDLAMALTEGTVRSYSVPGRFDWRNRGGNGDICRD